jgi:rubrerythrin
MTELKESKMEKNLRDKFAGESLVRNQYAYFSSKAKKDGFLQISRIFEEIADNEKNMRRFDSNH